VDGWNVCRSFYPQVWSTAIQGAAVGFFECGEVEKMRGGCLSQREVERLRIRSGMFRSGEVEGLVRVILGFGGVVLPRRPF